MKRGYSSIPQGKKIRNKERKKKKNETKKRSVKKEKRDGDEGKNEVELKENNLILCH
jgi:hypothetical protein